MVSNNKIRNIQKIVQKHMSVLMYLAVGEGELSEDVLSSIGIPKELQDVARACFSYGRLEMSGGRRLDEVSPEEVRKLLSKVEYSPAQERALDFVRATFGNEVQNLSNKAVNMITGVITRGQLGSTESIQDVLADGIESHTPISTIAGKLSSLTGDIERDWHRVAQSEMWNAKLYGEVISILTGESPLSQDKEDTIVFKRPAHNACPHCVKHYLEKDGKTPRLFKLSELLNNGSNIGNKSIDYKAVLGIMHPNCVCVLGIMPKGYEFDSEGKLVPKKRDVNLDDLGITIEVK